MAEKDEGNEEGGLKVNDRRRFTEDGTPKGSSGESAEKESAPVSPDEGKKNETNASRGAGRELPQIDFSTFVLSLATSVQVHLGSIPNPSTGKAEKDLPSAKQTIDIIGMMKEKTKGNVTPDEERLIDYILYDLRMVYVEKCKSQA